MLSAIEGNRHGSTRCTRLCARTPCSESIEMQWPMADASWMVSKNQVLGKRFSGFGPISEGEGEGWLTQGGCSLYPDNHSRRSSCSWRRMQRPGTGSPPTILAFRHLKIATRSGPFPRKPHESVVSRPQANVSHPLERSWEKLRISPRPWYTAN